MHSEYREPKRPKPLDSRMTSRVSRVCPKHTTQVTPTGLLAICHRYLTPIPNPGCSFAHLALRRTELALNAQPAKSLTAAPTLNRYSSQPNSKHDTDSAAQIPYLEIAVLNDLKVRKWGGTHLDECQKEDCGGRRTVPELGPSDENAFRRIVRICWGAFECQRHQTTQKRLPTKIK